MKNKFIFFLSLIGVSTYAQVAIGKDVITNNSVSLEFGSANRGLLLPWVNSSSAVTSAVNGTLIFDASDKKVKYRKAGTWFDLTINTNGAVDTSLQNSLTENSLAKVNIGANSATDSTSGILILSDTDKAMVLPKVENPHLNIINPSAGMIVYDTINHQMAVYNGTVWTFWKP